MDKLTKIGLNSNVPEELSDHEIVEDDLAVYDNKKETSETNENKAPLRSEANCNVKIQMADKTDQVWYGTGIHYTPPP